MENLLLAAPELDHLEFCGLMTVPPFTDDLRQARPYFRKLRELRDQIRAQPIEDRYKNAQLAQLNARYQALVQDLLEELKP